MDFTSLNAALVQTKAIGGGGKSTGCHHHHIWQSFPIMLVILYLFHAVTYHRKSPMPNSQQRKPNLQLLVRAVLKFTCVLLLVFFFLVLFICLVSISTLYILSFPVLLCLVLVFFIVFEESQSH